MSLAPYSGAMAMCWHFFADCAGFDPGEAEDGKTTDEDKDTGGDVEEEEDGDDDEEEGVLLLQPLRKEM